MSEIASAIDTIYKKFVIRDILSFIVPGGIVLMCLLYGSRSNYCEVKEIILKLPFIAYFALFGGLYVIGYLCQIIGICIYKRWDGMRCSEFKNKFIHNRKDDRQHLQILRNFYDINHDNAEIMDQHERFVVLKQMAGNNGIALILGPVLLVVWKYFNRDQVAFLEQFNKAEYIVITMMIISGLLLLRHHRHQKEEQMVWEDIYPTRLRPVRRIWVRKLE